MTTTIDDVEEFLEDDFSMPDEAAANVEERAHISVQCVVRAIEAIAPVADDLDHQPKLKMLHSALDGLIADIPADERGPVETALLPILKTKQATDDFLSQIPVPATGPVFAPYSFDELMAMPPKEWLIDQVIGAGDLGVIYGAPGCGKTFAGINMIVAACTGSQWAGRFDIVRPLNVAYCAGEGISGLPARFKAAASVQRIPSLPNFTFFKVVPQLFSSADEATIATIHKFVAEWKERQAQGQTQPLDLLFVDTLSTASMGANENDNADMNRIAACCRGAATELGCAVILVHHTNKAGTAERGATALRGAADCMIEIKRLSEITTKAVMRCSKLKDGESWKDQTFDLHKVEEHDSVCILWDEPSDGTQATGQKSEDKATLQSEMERYAGQRFTAKRLAEAIDKRENYTRNLLSELEKAGICQRELNDPKKQMSSRNPWVFFIPAMQGELDAAQAEDLGL